MCTPVTQQRALHHGTLLPGHVKLILADFPSVRWQPSKPDLLVGHTAARQQEKENQ